MIAWIPSRDEQQGVAEVRMAPEDHQDWRKSSYSGSSNNSCVEVTVVVGTVAVRDSKNVGRTAPAFSGTAWRAFATGL
jgi:hypothetical protein